MKGATRSFVIVVAMVTTLATVATGAAVAERGGQGKGHQGGGSTTSGSSSFDLAMVNDANGDGLPNFGDSVTFDVSTTETNEPHISLKCYQGGVLVYGAVTGFYPDYLWPWTQIMTLSSSSWTGGAADCTAGLYYFSGAKVVTIETKDFHVDA